MPELLPRQQVTSSLALRCRNLRLRYFRALLRTLRFAINGMADLGPVGQQERIASYPSCGSDFPSNELLEDGIKKRVATLAAQHVALVAGVQQNGLALALRSLGEG